MEQTKIYLVLASTTSFLGGDLVDCAFLSKKDAEYYKWEKDKEFRSRSRMYPVIYQVKEVEIESIVTDTKSFKKFCEEKIIEVEKSIKEKELCSEKDLEKIAKLNREKEYYQNLK